MSFSEANFHLHPNTHTSQRFAFFSMARGANESVKDMSGLMKPLADRMASSVNYPEWSIFFPKRIDACEKRLSVHHLFCGKNGPENGYGMSFTH
jgi:hypothetical protein